MIENQTPEAEEQTTRIQEAWDEARENLQDYTLSDLEDIFEDRDPFEFIW